MDNSRNKKLGAIAVAVVALVGVGAAVAASQLHGGDHAAAATQTTVAPYDGQRRGFGFRGGGLSAVSTYLGLSTQQLFTQLQSGKTLAQIANATSGKSAAGLIAALVADAKQRFGANVPSDLEQRITDLVNGVHPQRPHDDGPGHGFFRRIGSRI